MPGERRWSWAALVTAIVIWAAGLPTWGLSSVLAPLGLALSLVAARRAPRDGLFWVGLTLNVLLTLGFVSLLVALAIGEAAIGFE